MVTYLIVVAVRRVRTVVGLTRRLVAAAVVLVTAVLNKHDFKSKIVNYRLFYLTVVSIQYRFKCYFISLEWCIFQRILCKLLVSRIQG